MEVHGPITRRIEKARAELEKENELFDFSDVDLDFVNDEDQEKFDRNEKKKKKKKNEEKMSVRDVLLGKVVEKELDKEFSKIGMTPEEVEKQKRRLREFEEDSQEQTDTAYIKGESVPDIHVVDSRLPEKASAPTENNGLTEEQKKIMYSRTFTMAMLKWIENLPPGTTLELPVFEYNLIDEKFVRVGGTEKIEITNNFWERMEKEADERIVFRQLTEVFLRRLITHGKAKKQEDGTVIIKQESDVDGEWSKYIIRDLVGVKDMEIEYATHGLRVPGEVYADMGDKDGVYYVVEQNGLGEWVVTVYFDHHDLESSGESSASGIVLETFAALGMIENPERFEKMTIAIALADNGKLPENYEEEVEKYVKSRKGSRRDYFLKIYSETLFGQKFPMKVDKMKMAYVDRKHKCLDVLNDNEKKDFGLVWENADGLVIDMFSQTKKNMESAVKAVQEIEEAGLVLETSEYGRILIDIGGRTMGLGNEVSRALGYDGILRWNEEENSFALTTVKELKLDFGDREGIIKVRKGLLMKKPGGSGIPIGLEEVLVKLAGVEKLGELKLTNGDYEKDKVNFPNEKKIRSETQKLRYLVNDFVGDLNKIYAEPTQNTELSRARWNLECLLARKGLSETTFIEKRISPKDGREMVKGIREFMATENGIQDGWIEVRGLVRESSISENDLKKARMERWKIIKNMDWLKMGEKDLIMMVSDDLDMTLAKAMYRAIKIMGGEKVYPEDQKYYKDAAEAAVFFKKYMKVEVPELKPEYYPEVLNDLEIGTLTGKNVENKGKKEKARNNLLSHGIDVAAIEFDQGLKDALDSRVKYDGKFHGKFETVGQAEKYILAYLKIKKPEEEPKPAEPVMAKVDKEGWKVEGGVEIGEEIEECLDNIGSVNGFERALLVQKLVGLGIRIDKFIELEQESGADVELRLRQLRNMVTLARVIKKDGIVEAEKEFPGLVKGFSLVSKMLGLKWG